MRYYVINKEEEPIAVVFHDYVSSKFIMRTVSEAFRNSFDSSVGLNSSLAFNKSDSVLKYKPFGPEFPSWIDKVLKKACGIFWNIKSTGDITGEAFIEDIVSQHLPKV